MMKRKKKLKSANGVDICINIFFAIVVSVSLIPMLHILSLSVSDEYAVLNNPGMLFPDFEHINLMPYVAVFRSTSIYRSLFISFSIVLLATLINMIFTIFTGFVLSNKDLPGRNLMMTFVLIIILFSGGLIPTYLTVSSYGLVDTYWVLVLLGAVNGYNIIFMKNFINGIPKSMTEAAQMEGANVFQLLVHIIIPLSKPVIATLSLFCAVGKWNDWSTAYIYIYNAKWLKPFQNVLQDIVVNPDTSNAYGLDLSEYGTAFQNALIVISLIPVVVLYLLSQKYLVKGLFVGSVKE
ncbi:MAG: carbohydrate ABC transporter permease [Tyzzerella sp.]|nr:carbohydrate ABC transporter permease [Tyzzerella sp.]